MSGVVEKYGSSWRIRWEAGRKPDGSRWQRSKAGYPTRKEAEVALRARLDEVRRGDVPDAGKITLSEFLIGWLDSKRTIRTSTRRSYEGHIRVHIIPHIGSVPLALLRAEHLDRMYADIRAGRLRPSPGTATIRRIHATLRTALNSAVRRRQISFNPAAQIELDAEPARERGVWTPSELQAFLAHAQADRLGAAMHLIASTGIRRGECCGLKWSDVDLDRATITIRRQLTQSGRARDFAEPKTRRGGRTLSLDAETVGVLRTHKAAQAVERLSWGAAYNALDLVFCKEDGAPVAPDQVSRRFITLSAEAGLPRIVLHGLRHTHASIALASGVPVAVMSKRLGHSRSSFTIDAYMHVLPEVDSDAAELIANTVRTAAVRVVGEAP